MTQLSLLADKIVVTRFYGDFVYKFKRIVQIPNFSDKSKKIIKRNKKVEYNMDFMQQSTCLTTNHGL